MIIVGAFFAERVGIVDGKMDVQGGVINKLRVERGKPYHLPMVLLLQRERDDGATPTMQVFVSYSGSQALNATPDPAFFGEAALDSTFVHEFGVPDDIPLGESTFYCYDLELLLPAEGRYSVTCRMGSSSTALPLKVTWA